VDAASCQVDFYVLRDPGLDDHGFACRLVTMAWERGHQITVAVPTAELARAFDELLWSCPEGRFIPHGIEGMPEAVAAPVRIAVAEQAGGNDCLINLCQQPVRDPGRYRRLLEIVPHRAPDRKASRDKFRYYREQGLDPQHHEITK